MCCHMVRILHFIYFLVVRRWTHPWFGGCYCGVGPKTGHGTYTLRQNKTYVYAHAKNEKVGPDIPKSVQPGTVIVEFIAESIL